MERFTGFIFTALIVISIGKSFCDMNAENTFNVVDQVYRNFATSKTEIFENVYDCIVACNTLQSCKGINFVSGKCILGLTDPVNADLLNCNTFARKSASRYLAKGMQFVSIPI